MKQYQSKLNEFADFLSNEVKNGVNTNSLPVILNELALLAEFIDRDAYKRGRKDIVKEIEDYLEK